MTAAALPCLLLLACPSGGETRPRPKGPLDRTQALEVARQELKAQEPLDADWVIDEAKTLEKEFGWVFFYAPRAYLKSGDPGDLIPGAGPLAVERAGGVTTVLSSSVPPDKAVEEFEKQWRKRGARKP